MKNIRLILLLCLWSSLLIPSLSAQTILLQESFETDGEGSRYTSNSGNDPTLSDVWERTDQNPHPYHSTIINAGTKDGSWNWVGEDVFSLNGGADGVLTLNPLTVSNTSSLEVQIAVAMSRFGQNRWENDDVLAIEYNLDGGGWNIAGLFTGDNPTVGIGGALRLDTDNNPATFGPFGAEITDTYVDYLFAIPATGNSLEVRVRTNCNGSEEIAFDNLRIRGIASMNDAPVLANIEGTPIAYTEGDPATQLTNTLTVSDNDNTELASATVSITGGFNVLEDVLAASPSGGIVASYSFGVLTLSGTASLADYETTLRSVTYENTNTVNPSTATRTISFAVNDGTDPSNVLIRDIEVTGLLNPAASLPFCESLETDGEGTRYTANSFEVGCNLAIRETSADALGCFAESLTGADGIYRFNTEDTDSNGGFTMTSQDLDISTLGLAELTIEVLLAVSRDDEARWENDDQFRVEYSIDGGPFSIVGLFTGDNPGIGLGGNLFEDTDQDPATFGPFAASAVPDTFTNYSFTFQGSGSTLNYRIVVLSNGTEELAFDNICVSGITLCTNDTTNLTTTTCDPSQAGIFEELFTNAGGCDSLVITTTTLDPAADAGADSMITVMEGDSVDLDTIVTVSGGTFAIGDSMISNVFAPSGLGDTTLVVSYVVPSNNTCPDDTATITITVRADPTSNDVLLVGGEQVQVSLYPNPASGHLFVRSSQILKEPLTFQVYNLQGQALSKGEAAIGTNQANVSVASLPSGIYLLRITTGTSNSLLRFVKQ